MSKTKQFAIAFLCVLTAFFSILSVNLFSVSAEVSPIQNSDFSGMSGAESGNVNADNTDQTDIVLPYSEGSGIYYGGADAAYKVDMANFDWSITIGSFAVGQSFTVSFVADTSAMPFKGAVGVSYVFHRVQDAINIYILDASDGSLLQEMIDTQSMWAYYKDGEFPEYPKTDGDDGYCGGMVGKLYGEDFSGQTLRVINMVDGASYAGTTFRPALGGTSLGRTVPGTIFDNRDLKISDLTLILSAGGQNGIGDEPKEDITFTVNTPGEKNTKAYRSESTRLQLVTRLAGYVADSEAALKGELSADEFAAMLADVEDPDLSILRLRDRYLQEQNLSAIRENLAQLDEILAQLPQIVTDYSTALEALKEAGDITEESVQAAREAKAAYEEKSAFIGYLQGDAADTVNGLVAALNEKLLERGEVELQVRAYEAKTADMDASATPAQIVEAQAARAQIDAEKLAGLDSADKAAVEARIEACDDKVEQASVGKNYAVEEYKIGLYDQAVSALDAESSLEQFRRAYAQRPELELDAILPSDRPVLEQKLADADAKLGGKIAAVFASWADVYGEKVYYLGDLNTLTQQKIDDAANVAYDKDVFDGFCAIADGISYDLSEEKAVLAEYDRVVAAASVRLLLVTFNNLVEGEVADIAVLDNAYNAYKAVEAGDLSGLSEAERTAYETMLESALQKYEAAAIALIGPAMEAFEAAVNVEDIDTLPALSAAKSARSAVPSLQYLLLEEDLASYTERYRVADEKLRSQVLYYIQTGGTSWTASETETGLRLDNQLGDADNCDGLAVIEDALPIDGFDFAFEFTEIGRLWKGEDPVGSGKYPQAIYVMNIVNEKGKNKDEAQGFSLYFYCNHLNELEVMVYGAANSSGEVMLAQGKVADCGFTADPYVPYTVRVRITVDTNCYRIWVNSLQMTIYFRDIVNPSSDKPTHLPEYAEGDEIGGVIFNDGQAYVTFVVFASDLSAEERSSAITIRMIGDKTFGDYVPPLYMVSVELLSGPDKTTYQKGESFDKTGIRMQATMSDGSVVDIPLASIKVLGFTSTSKGTKNVSLSYTDASGVTLTKVIRVTIVDAEEDDSVQPADGLPGWAIALIVVGAVIVVGGGTTAAVLLAKKKKNGAKEENIDEKKE